MASSPTVSTRGMVCLAILSIVLLGDLMWTFTIRSSLMTMMKPDDSFGRTAKTGSTGLRGGGIISSYVGVQNIGGGIDDFDDNDDDYYYNNYYDFDDDSYEALDDDTMMEFMYGYGYNDDDSLIASNYDDEDYNNYDNDDDDDDDDEDNGEIMIDITNSLQIHGKDIKSVEIKIPPVPDTVPLEPIWQCHGPKNGVQKLFFVHIYKTAGSTLRHLLQDYAEKCKAGYSLVIGCSDLQEPTIQNTTTAWKGRNGQDCVLKQSISRDDGKEMGIKKVTTSFLNENTDILGGHIQLGSDAEWTVQGEPVDTHYLSFFRHPIDKFVSGKLYETSKKGWNLSFDEALEHIRKNVKTNLEKGNYQQRYRDYLVTPQQREILFKRGMVLTPEQFTELTMSNLIVKSDKIIFGVVEHMSESLEMLQYVIDGEQQTTEIFQEYGMEVHAVETDSDSSNNSNVTTPIVHNQSKYSTSEVIKELTKDPEFAKLLEEINKYEMPIYELAVELHKKQYQTFTEARANKAVQ